MFQLYLENRTLDVQISRQTIIAETWRVYKFQTDMEHGLDISSEAEFPPDLVEALSGTHKFVSKIGAGAMGAVYRTRDMLERDEALKIISGNISPERLKRLRLEAQCLGRAPTDAQRPPGPI